MNWKWNHRPISSEWQFKGKENTPSVVLEPVCDGELWRWNSLFGSTGTMNDMKVLETRGR